MAVKKQSAVQSEPLEAESEPAKPQKTTQVSIANLKGSEAYREWMMGFHKQTHIPPTTLLRLGLAELAQKYAYGPPPER